MADRKEYKNIPVEPGYFSELQVLKAQYQRWVHRSVTWTQFLEWMVGNSLAEMRQGEPMSEEELAEAGWVPADALTVALAQERGGRVELSAASIERIAVQLHKLMTG